MTPLDLVQIGERAALGAFFTISGAHKLFVPEVNVHFRHLFERINLPKLWPVVAWAELAGGLGVLTGTLTQLAAAGLILILLGAIKLDVWESDIKGKHPRDLSDWIAKILYCPEVLMIFWLGSVILLGPGTYSVDAIIPRFL